MAQQVFRDWSEAQASQWGHAPQRLAHPWHESPLFARAELAALIERYPVEHYALVATSTLGVEGRRWREGELGDFSGEEVIDAISQGGLWLNLRNVHLVDARYAALQEAAYAELQRAMPAFTPGALRMGILISSPRAQVHYHCDLPGQALWQIAGRKRVLIYPPRAPYLPDEVLEDVALTGVEVKMPYDPAFDRDATVMELEPGQMLHWPLNSPHRVDNHDCLNISVTTEHWTPHIRRSQMVNVANGVLRQKLGVQPSSRRLDGPLFWGKAAFQAAWRRGPWAHKAQRMQRPIDFRLSRDQPNGLQDIPAYYR
jgi:hypothetical protein